MTSVLFSVGAKGGVGKSTVLRHVAEWTISLGLPPLLIDADDENRSLTRFFPTASPVEVSKPRVLDALVHRLLEERPRVAIIDLKAGVREEMARWFADIPFEDLAQEEIKFTAIAVLTNNIDSHMSVLNWVNLLGPRVRWLVVRNHVYGNFENHLDKTVQGREFYSALKPVTIDLEQWDGDYQAALERSSLLVTPLLEGKTHDPLLSAFLHVRKLRTLQAKMFSQLSTHQNYLLHDQNP